MGMHDCVQVARLQDERDDSFREKEAALAERETLQVQVGLKPSAVSVGPCDIHRPCLHSSFVGSDMSALISTLVGSGHAMCFDLGTVSALCSFLT